MKTIKTAEDSIEELYIEWIAELTAYEHELQSIDGTTRQLQMSVNDLFFQRELRELRNEIVMLKSLIGSLSGEVLEMKKRFDTRNEEQEITLPDLIENNRFREKIRKAEHSVFMLRYQVNKLLSKAS